MKERRKEEMIKCWGNKKTQEWNNNRGGWKEMKEKKMRESRRERAEIGLDHSTELLFSQQEEADGDKQFQ